MARVLDALTPLTGLLTQAGDPVAAAHRLAASAAAGAAGCTLVAQLQAAVADSNLARVVLQHAGVLDPAGAVTVDAAVRLAQAAVLAEAHTADTDRWELVLTVPGFLRLALDELVAVHGEAARPAETTRAVLEVAGRADRRLLIGAPFLHGEFVGLLVPYVQRVLAGGGQVVVVTRALSVAAPGRSSANVAAVTVLRDAAAAVGGTLTVRSWEESGLGIHFKVVIAYGHAAYLGSANPTLAGSAGHAEAGVLLHGPRLAPLERWLDAVCDELARRRLPQA